MKNYLKIIMYLVLICSLSIPALASWKISKKAEIKNYSKHILILERKPSGRVFAKFVLPIKINKMSSTKRPLYKVDDKKVRSLKKAKKLQFSQKTKSISWITWEIFEGNGKPNKELMEIMTGKKLVFQYYMPDGEIKETSFKIKGAFKAISKILY